LRPEGTTDWERCWRALYDRCRGSALSEENDEMAYWDGLAQKYSELRAANDFEFGRRVRDLLWGAALDQDSLVLDVGAGPGSLLVPFARRAAWVDAVEPSAGMVGQIKRNTEAEGISNYRLLSGTWQEVDTDRLEGRYDLVVGSLVIFFFRNLWGELARMEKTSRAYCCLVTPTGSGREGDDRLKRRLIGRRKPPWFTGEEYSVARGLLKSKGRALREQSFLSIETTTLEEKIRRRTLFFGRYLDLSPQMHRTIHDHYASLSLGGSVTEERETAVIWWPLR
jgi:SAM-dependent methyltransferase